MGEHGSFTIPVMHYWSLPCVMVSDEGWCIVDRLHIELSPWLKSMHSVICALNFNYTNHIKRLDLNKNVCIQYSADVQRIICLYQRCTVVTNDAAPAGSASKKDYIFLIENDYFLLWFYQRILKVYFSPHLFLVIFCPSSVFLFLPSGRTPILLDL